MPPPVSPSANHWSIKALSRPWRSAPTVRPSSPAAKIELRGSGTPPRAGPSADRWSIKVLSGLWRSAPTEGPSSPAAKIEPRGSGIRHESARRQTAGASRLCPGCGVQPGRQVHPHLHCRRDATALGIPGTPDDLPRLSTWVETLRAWSWMIRGLSTSWTLPPGDSDATDSTNWAANHPRIPRGCSTRSCSALTRPPASSPGGAETLGGGRLRRARLRDRSAPYRPRATGIPGRLPGPLTPEKAAVEFAKSLELLPEGREFDSPRSMMILESHRGTGRTRGSWSCGRTRGSSGRPRAIPRLAKPVGTGRRRLRPGIGSAPPESEEWFEHACLRLIVGDKEGYRTFVQEMQPREGKPRSTRRVHSGS